MIFGYTFASGKDSMRPSPTPGNSITTVRVSNGVVDEVYMESDVMTYSTAFPTQWNFKTAFDAKFNGDLLAGNTLFAAKEVASLRLKRRKKGKSAWDTIYEQTVNGDATKLNFTFYDKTCRANTSYEYTIVPVIGQVEGNFYTNEIKTNFVGLYLMDSNYIYQTELDVNISPKRTKPRNVISTINRRCPYVVSNGAINYENGTVSAQWVSYDQLTDVWDIDGQREYLTGFEDFLNNGQPKIMKYEDGRMWLIEVSSSDITQAEEYSVAQVHTSFDWTEIGDADSMSDLYLHGLSDVEV